jgi:integrase
LFILIIPKEINNRNTKIFSRDEQRRLTDYLIGNIDIKNSGILLSLYTGIRIGELCAIQWKNIDVKTKSISIEKTLQRIYLKSDTGKGKLK